MTKQNLQNQLSILLWLWGYALLFATESSANNGIYTTPQTLIQGIENIHFSDTLTTTILTDSTEKAIIYIAADVVFTAQEELLHRVKIVTFDFPKSKSSPSQVVVESKIFKSVVVSKDILCENKIPNPFDNIPNQKTENSVLSVFSNVTTYSNPTFSTSLIICNNAYDFLNGNRLDAPQSIVQITNLKSNFYQSQHTTRPPPSSLRVCTLSVV